MDVKARQINSDDINPRHNWGRALPALGIMGVDFEERVDYRRMHQLPAVARVKHGTGEIRSGCAAPLRRQQHPLHNVDQDRRMGARQALALDVAHAYQRRSYPLGLSAPPPMHHRLYSPWLEAGQLQGRARRPARHRASVVRIDEAARRGDRFAVPKEAGCRRHAASASTFVEPPMMFELQKAGLKVQPTASRSCWKRARSSRQRRDRAAQPRRRDGGWRLRPDQREAAARHPRKRHRRRGQQVPLHPRLR